MRLVVIVNSATFVLIVLAWGVMAPLLAFGSTSDGGIDSEYHNAWGQNVGWINFAPSAGNVHITDSEITGYIWSEQYGWINLHPASAGVFNNAEGTLSGYAWGTNLGWIDFSGVTISSGGVFHGSATGTLSGIISFDCTECVIKTDWRPASVRNVVIPSNNLSNNSTAAGAPLPVGNNKTLASFSATSSAAAPSLSVVIENDSTAGGAAVGRGEVSSVQLNQNTNGSVLVPSLPVPSLPPQEVLPKKIFPKSSFVDPISRIQGNVSSLPKRVWDSLSSSLFFVKQATSADSIPLSVPILSSRKITPTEVVYNFFRFILYTASLWLRMLLSITLFRLF